MKNKPNSTTLETQQPTKHKTGFQETYASVAQGTNNTNTNVSITHKSNNTNAQSKSQTLLNKLKILKVLETLPKQDKSQVQGTKKNEIQILKES